MGGCVRERVSGHAADGAGATAPASAPTAAPTATAAATHPEPDRAARFRGPALPPPVTGNWSTTSRRLQARHGGRSRSIADAIRGAARAAQVAFYTQVKFPASPRRRRKNDARA